MGMADILPEQTKDNKREQFGGRRAHALGVHRCDGVDLQV